MPEVVFNEFMNGRSCLRQKIPQRFSVTFFLCFSAQKYCLNTKSWMSRNKKVLEKNLRGGWGKEGKAQNVKCKIKQGCTPSGGRCPHQLHPQLIGFLLSCVFVFFSLDITLTMSVLRYNLIFFFKATSYITVQTHCLYADRKWPGWKNQDFKKSWTSLRIWNTGSLLLFRLFFFF